MFFAVDLGGKRRLDKILWSFVSSFFLSSQSILWEEKEEEAVRSINVSYLDVNARAVREIGTVDQFLDPVMVQLRIILDLLVLPELEIQHQEDSV